MNSPTFNVSVCVQHARRSNHEAIRIRRKIRQGATRLCGYARIAVLLREDWMSSARLLKVLPK